MVCPSMSHTAKSDTAFTHTPPNYVYMMFQKFLYLSEGHCRKTNATVWRKFVHYLIGKFSSVLDIPYRDSK